ncbi:hypothetical protein Ddye_028433 [Dipteronia dyeriana]|uniref:Disease resistance protein At4g27190-like leucine-rich repeats domain-containing protein n=1 Tax=Dipteronia dyeriana TaxID=168575 RepID=A0AAD9WSB3_9ROSI|nr:hypothetical protein Ddye_028433 [Dipteronia dyeriana]
MPLLNEKVLFPNLEALELSAIKVEKIWHNQLPANCIQNLTRLILQGCGNLKNLFSSSIANGFVQLQYLEICKCEVLEEIVVIEDSREGESNDILFPQLNYLRIEDLGNLKRFYSVENQGSEIQPFFDEKVAFPILEELVISHMESLKMLWHNQLAEDSFRKLKLMKVDCCDKLLTVFPCNILRRFSRLESLTVADSDSIEEIFQLQGINLEEKKAEAVTQLRKLYIHGLSKLSYIWNMDPKGYLSFQNLQMVRVSECQSLKYLFPASIARSLLHLEKLYVENCGWRRLLGRKSQKQLLGLCCFHG